MIDEQCQRCGFPQGSNPDIECVGSTCQCQCSAYPQCQCGGYDKANKETPPAPGTIIAKGRQTDQPGIPQSAALNSPPAQLPPGFVLRDLEGNVIEDTTLNPPPTKPPGAKVTMLEPGGVKEHAPLGSNAEVTIQQPSEDLLAPIYDPATVHHVARLICNNLADDEFDAEWDFRTQDATVQRLGTWQTIVAAERIIRLLSPPSGHLLVSKAAFERWGRAMKGVLAAVPDFKGKPKDEETPP